MNRSARALTVCAFCCIGVTPSIAQQAPHLAHGPRLGGAFATAAGDTLHVEALFSEQRRIRLFLTDTSGSPIPLEMLRAVDARAIAGDSESPFTLLEADHYFESRIPTLPMPAVIVVRLKSSPSAPEDRLRFSFGDYSPAGVFDNSSPVEIPGTLEGIMRALNDERRIAQSIIDRGQFPELLGSEDRIRDLVLALEPHLEGQSTGVRVNAQAAITSVVRACWLLHTVMDYGTAQQRDAAFAQIAEALDQVVAAVSGRTP